MEHYESTSATRTIMTFLGGLAVGYGVALLFAPRSGRETREMITDYAQSAGERISTIAKSAMDSARQSAETASQRVGEYVDEARSKATKAASSAARSSSTHQ